MTTTLTPPPPASATPLPQPGPPAPRYSRVVAILAMTLGALLIAGVAIGSVFSFVRAAGVREDTLTASTTDLGALTVDISTGSVEIVYGDVTEAELNVLGQVSDWKLERSGDTLTVSTHRGWLFGWNWLGDGDRAILTLPQSLRDAPLDATLRTSAGSIDASGTFGTLELDLSAGSIGVSGSAERVTVEVSAGSARLDLADVDSAAVTVSAGSAVGDFTGTAPTSVDLDVSAGRIALDVPDETYAVSTRESAGSISYDVQTGADSPHRIDAEVSAGSIDIGVSSR